MITEAKLKTGRVAQNGTVRTPRKLSLLYFLQRSHSENACAVASFKPRHAIFCPPISDLGKFRSLSPQIFAIMGRALTIFTIFRKPFDGISVALD